MNIRKSLLLRDDEKVLHVYRHHWLRYGSQIFLGLLFFLGPFILIMPLLAQQQYGLYAFLVLIGIGALLLLRVFLIWHSCVFVITSTRAIDVDQQAMFRRVVSEAPYESITNVSYQVDGVLGTIFNFGTISLETPGSSRIVFDNLPHPQEAHRLLTDQVASRHSKPNSANERVGALLDAATELSPTEARALRVALDQKTSEVQKPAATKNKKKTGPSDQDVAPFVS